MGIWDDLKGLVQKKGEEASEAAARAAAEKAVRAVKDTVSAVGDDFLDFAEGELKREEEGRKGRVGVLPSGEEASAIAARIEAAAKAAAAGSAEGGGESAAPSVAGAGPDPGRDDPTVREDPVAKARAELERLKAELRAGREAFESGRKGEEPAE